MPEYSIATTSIAGDDSSAEKVYKCGIVMPVYNRPGFLKRCLKSLANSELKDCLIIFLDDASDNPQTIQLMSEFRHRDADTILIRRAERPQQDGGLTHTLHDNLSFTLNYMFGVKKCQYCAILDSDTIVKPDWIAKMLDLYRRQENARPLIVSGFNTLAHKEIGEERDFYYKQSLGGASMLFNYQTFIQIFVPLKPYWDEAIISKMRLNAYPMLCIKPSVVQHIGFRGSFSYLWDVDFAHDYIRPYWLWRLAYISHQGFYRFMLIFNDSIRHRFKRYLNRRKLISFSD